MTSTTSSVPSAGLSIVTPANWARLDVDPRTRDRSIREFVKRSVGPDDRLARYRQEAVVAYRRFAADAADRGAFMVALVSDIVEGTPMFASLMAFLVPSGIGPDGSLVTAVDEMGPLLAEPEPGERIVESGPVELRLGPAHRVRSVLGSGMHGSDGVEARVDQVRFFVPVPDQEAMLVLAFSTPIVDLGDGFAELFDQMALTARWRPARSARSSS
jgi:hypothetical protein